MKTRRTNRSLKKPVKPFEGDSLRLNTEKLFTDLTKKLNAIKQSQGYLTKRLNISRSTLWRVSQNKEITVQTFLKLVSWLEEDVNRYIKSINQ